MLKFSFFGLKMSLCVTSSSQKCQNLAGLLQAIGQFQPEFYPFPPPKRYLRWPRGGPPVSISPLQAGKLTRQWIAFVGSSFTGKPHDLHGNIDEHPRSANPWLSRFRCGKPPWFLIRKSFKFPWAFPQGLALVGLGAGTSARQLLRLLPDRLRAERG